VRDKVRGQTIPVRKEYKFALILGDSDFAGQVLGQAQEAYDVNSHSKPKVSIPTPWAAVPPPSLRLTLSLSGRPARIM